MTNIVLFMISTWFGVSLFFSFDVAPTLFDTLSTMLAGDVVAKIFPMYFGIGLFIFLMSFFILFLSEKPTFRKNFAFLILNIVIFIAFLVFILPEASFLKHTDYHAFLRLHAFSMVLNLIQMINSFFIILSLI
ncbi:putative protein [Hydrogenobaculum sp. Y04AAS1]|uniref:DUF4149 domain-containing protein n=1 Tax=Hydrogenobaculum sp. (strain Y04AAS1) TaxID=380749 RepID=UPI00017BBE5A|nr:putative protein [Hydrogenobaculum sp. Y04AAS1]HCT67272.1 DUF4149 domain-containing protein [Hydrogenobaculum sp.]